MLTKGWFQKHFDAIANVNTYAILVVNNTKRVKRTILVLIHLRKLLLLFTLGKKYFCSMISMSLLLMS